MQGGFDTLGIIQYMERRRESTVTVVIAEPLNIVRAGLRALLDREPGIEVVGDAGYGTELVDLVERVRPDVLVLLPSLPGPSPSQLLVQARLAYPMLKVLALAGPQDEATALELIESNDIACFFKSDRPEEFLRGVRAAIIEDELSISSTVARRLLVKRPMGKSPLPANGLTERERDILGFLATGLSNKASVRTFVID
ncbi:MAG: response regulator transcription factor [Chloroflexi bacterium]|nr:response regulator transcription factor [Chloroflexota bacterium]